MKRFYDISRTFESASSILKFISVNMSAVYLAIRESVHIWESYTPDGGMEPKIQGKFGNMVAANMNFASDALVESDQITKGTKTVISLTVHNCSHW